MKVLFVKCTWIVCGKQIMIEQQVLSKCVHAHQLAKDCKNVNKIFVGCKTYFFPFTGKNIVMSLLFKNIRLSTLMR